MAQPIGNFTTHPRNVRQGDVGAICASLEAHGQYRPIVVHQATNQILAGNHTYLAALALGWDKIAVTFVDCNDEQALRILLTDNRANDLATYDDTGLAELLKELSVTDLALTGTMYDADDFEALLNNLGGFELPADVDDVPDDVPAVSKLGDVWVLGEHRVMCGDSTMENDVAKLMNGRTAQLLHADPPYGMGKENEGVLNDNLYAGKLDTFQMSWWKVCRKFLDDNASAYIWGKPEDLWRLWFVGGLKDSERLTLRNEVVWFKGDFNGHVVGMGQSTEHGRMFASLAERCLFFMLGEQGFNNNSDNYWEGWEKIRSYLETEMNKCGGQKNWRKALGNQMGQHYFTKSQWCFPTQEAYEKLQAFARGDAFKQEYDALKQEYDALKQDFYATRAHFDNSHDNMHDVWFFHRPHFLERFGHATLKPVEMMCRVFKSSAPPDSITIEPFGGSGSTLIAAQETNRIAYLMELDPYYVDVICARFQKHTGIKPILEASGEPHDFGAQ